LLQAFWKKESDLREEVFNAGMVQDGWFPLMIPRPLITEIAELRAKKRSVIGILANYADESAKYPMAQKSRRNVNKLISGLNSLVCHGQSKTMKQRKFSKMILKKGRGFTLARMGLEPLCRNGT